MQKKAILKTLAEHVVNDQTLRSLLSVVAREITLSTRRIEDVTCSEDNPWFLDDECDHIEQLLGLAFVTAQTYLTTVTSRLARFSNICNKNVGKPLSFVASSKHHDKLMKLDNPIFCETKYHEIEVINAIANYWKHQEDWPTCTEIVQDEHGEEYRERIWDQKQMKKDKKPGTTTIEIVMCIGMSPSSTGNLRTAFEALSAGSNDYANFSPIREKLLNWTHCLQKKAQSEIANF